MQTKFHAYVTLIYASLSSSLKSFSQLQSSHLTPQTSAKDIYNKRVSTSRIETSRVLLALRIYARLCCTILLLKLLWRLAMRAMGAAGACVGSVFAPPPTVTKTVW